MSTCLTMKYIVEGYGGSDNLHGKKLRVVENRTE